MAAELILKYFPELTEEQQRQFEMLDALYRDWNAKINVISRKDIDQLYEHHVLHSLAIAKTIRFRPGTQILDFGTGGGFPGIPLAILFPDCRFKLIDGTGKKIRVAQEVSDAIGLKNCHPEHLRGEDALVADGQRHLHGAAEAVGRGGVRAGLVAALPVGGGRLVAAGLDAHHDGDDHHQAQ